LVTAAQRQSAAGQVTTAEIDLKSAQAELNLLETQVEIRAPADGVISAVVANQGQQVSPDAVIARLQPAGATWLEASFWGPDASAVEEGMAGEFAPGDGSSPIKVKLSRIIPPQQPDGSTLVACAAETSGATTLPSTPPWRVGEAGTVTLLGKARRVVEAPTSSLIMSAGQWWVMILDQGKEQPRQVEIGEPDGLNTVITHGISAGEAVVVTDAYLHFNHDFTKEFQQSD
jgi:multidrug efflux pump subunit AcrA (membrane-fusion protein)